ncbi:conserved hypothetical protein (plasmid) [Tsukamurella paurometabola DSM 20162]|uniref:FAD-dependent urate hydroxylase HpyO/Asp monooxygenase CreE-like FAD/NAD(P)-binding domain-containing protein n=1 Tax=Tsukamurella paurometabola (strain ATCC 8368 / DSM 20162 / CCUG 35730 / CIP 100753 / JCM 10117 / KCTC 9821 / NBRC 16120 / NCIMB 702349 / NCTC 13040) TaxID=521096 RepID=D5UZ10_TSUPD|nr:conserved hypothetical protein [Tsukamurella paurometabola DSM 20162]
MGGVALRVGIVGGGPRCVAAMESLIAECEHDLPELIIFEPHSAIGPGWAYDPQQPEWNLLNVAADAILPATTTSPRFVDWLRVHHPYADHLFPPRALAGRYLVEAATSAARRFPTVTHIGERAHNLTSTDSGWVVHAGAQHHTVDAVLLVTGHAATWSGQLQAAAPAYPQTYAGGPLPESVAIRGAALSAIDATLACTQGSGGRFTAVPGRPHEVAYQPSPDSPQRIHWFSRTGRLMCAKTDRAVLNSMRWLPAIARTRAKQLATEDTALVVNDAAAQILVRIGGDETRRTDDPRAWLERDLLIAHGARPPDLLWAQGQAWKALYPHLIERHLRLQQSGGAPPEGWTNFSKLCQAMEPLAFGPPAINAEKMLALVHAGVLSIDAGTTPPRADLVIDAVLAPAGLPDSTDSLWHSLREQGLIERATDRDAVAIDLDATVLVGGERIEGLAVFGRSVEGVVLGTDTLNHVLHPHLHRWAAQLRRT